MKRINVPLILGIAIVLALVILSLYPESFTPVDPYSTRSVFTDASGEMHSAPYPPSLVPPFGSDELGRNIYSQLIFGAGQTMKIVLVSVLVILMLSFPLGMTAGFGSRTGIWLLKVANTTSSAIPALLLCILILNLPYFSMLDKKASLYAFSIVIAVVGFGRMGTLIRHKVEAILGEPFIEGQIVIGKSRPQIAFQNVLPHLLPNILVYLALEAGRTLFLLCQLGVFSVFVGKMKYTEMLRTVGRNMAYEPEWGTMLGTAIPVFKIYPWLVFPLIGAFFVGILGFNMLAEGLKIEFEKKNSHFITWVRKIPYFLSPRMLVKDIGRIPQRPAPGLIKLAVILLVLAVLFHPKQFAYYPFDHVSAWKITQELSSDPYEGRRSGTEGRDLAADFLVAKLKEAGIRPGGAKGYLNEFPMDDSRMISGQRLFISQDGKEYTELVPEEDYRVVNFQPVNYEGEVEIVHGAGSSLKTNPPEAQRPVRIFVPDKIRAADYLFMLQDLSMGKAAILVVSEQNFKGISLRSQIGYERIRIPIIELAPKWKETVLQSEKLRIKAEISILNSEPSTGKNLIGLIPGTDPALKDEYIVVGASSAAICLESAKAIKKKGPPKRIPKAGNEGRAGYHRVSGGGCHAEERCSLRRHRSPRGQRDRKNPQG